MQAHTLVDVDRVSFIYNAIHIVLIVPKPDMQRQNLYRALSILKPTAHVGKCMYCTQCIVHMQGSDKGRSRAHSTGQRNRMKSAADVKAFVGNRGLRTNAKRHCCGGRQMICLSVLLVELIKILNMSNNAGRPSNTSFIGCP